MHQEFEDQQVSPSSEQFEWLFTTYISNDTQPLTRELKQIGDLENSLNTDKSKGIINENKLKQNLELYGSNDLQILDQASLISEIILSFQSWISLPIIIGFSDFILQIINQDNIYYPYAWIEGKQINYDIILGFLVFILLLALTIYQSYNTYQTKQQKNMLENFKKQSQTVKVVRFGQEQEILDQELVVGDILYIQEGQTLSVDGILLKAHGVITDESAVTGNTDDVQKSSLESFLENTSNFPILISGSQVISGEGTMIVLAVGQRSINAKLVQVLGSDSEQVSNQGNIDLSKILSRKFILIIQIAIFVAAIIFLFKTLKFNNFTILSFCTCLNHLLLYLLFIIGLVDFSKLIQQQASIALAKMTKTLLRENNLVRKLSSIEKLGQIDYICTDKTGVLTLNELGVVTHYSDQYVNVDDYQGLNEYWKAISRCCLVTCGNSKSDQAITKYIKNIVNNPDDIVGGLEIIKEIPFSSLRKRNSTICQVDNQILMFTKGPFESMLPYLKAYLTSEAENRPLDEQMQHQLKEVYEKMQSNSQRVICIAYRPLKDINDLGEVQEKNLYQAEIENEFVLLGILGIRDLLRREIPSAISLCQDAGINVIIMTGDNMLTANQVGKDINLISSSEHISVEGPEFSEIIRQGQFAQIQKNLRVVARARPEDKLNLVKQLQSQGIVVAVTGDGTNDAPALKQADVGYALGISSTEVARDASDVILLDDNFYSAVRGILLGRNFYQIIKKLIKAELTTSLALLGVLIIGAILNGQWVFNLIQIIYIYFGCGLFQSFLLANEMPNISILKEIRPIKNNESLLTSKQFKQIICSSLFIIIAFGFLMFYQEYLPEYQDSYDSTYFQNNLQYKYSDATCEIQDNNLICKCNYENDCKKMASGRFYTLTGQDDYVTFWQIHHIYSRHFTFLFNVFIAFMIANTFNCRIIDGKLNVFDNLKYNLSTLYGIIVWMIVQVLIVTFGNGIFSSYNNYGLTIQQQLLSYGIGSCIIVVEVITKLLV